MTLSTILLLSVLAIVLLALLVAWPLLAGYGVGQAVKAVNGLGVPNDAANRAMRAELIASTRKAAGLPPL